MHHKCLKGFSLVLMTLGVSLGTFIQILDTSIANVSIPWIAGDLGASPDQGTWVITSFAVSNAIILPLTGWLAKRFGEVRVFTWSIFSFSIISWLCGMAWSLSLLIFLRVLQGAAAGSLIPLSQSLLLQNYPEEKKGAALGLWSMVVVVAPLLGPIMGGWITENIGWSWIFYINVPIGFTATFLVWKTLWGRDNPTAKIPIDWIGFVLLIIAVGCLQVTLDKGNELDWWSSPIIVTLSILSSLGFIFFIAWNLYSHSPVVDFTFFKDRNFVIGCLVGGVGFFLFFGSLVLQPLWLQVRENYTATWAGISVAPFGIFPFLLSGYIGRNIGRFNLRLATTFSFFILSISYFWVSNFTTSVSLYDIVMPRILQGFGLAFFFIPIISIALSEIPNESLASASGVFNFIRLLSGGGFGTAIFVTLWTRWEEWHHSFLAEKVTLYQDTTLNAIAVLRQAGFTGSQPYGILDTMVTEQASVLAVNDLYWISAWLFLLAIPIVWLGRPVTPAERQHALAGE